MDVCRILPFKIASSLGTLIGGFIATLPIRINELARANIRRVFPKKDEAWVRKVQFHSMISLARTFFEFPKVYTLPTKTFNKLVEYTGMEYLKSNPKALILTAHLGNWDVICRMMGRISENTGNVYRATNNPYVNKYMINMRAKAGGVQIPKGTKGARQIVKLLKTGGLLGMLMDQKMNDGIESTFLGQPAMTAPALAELAAKYDIPVLPISSIRQPDGTFLVTINEPIKMAGNKEQDTQTCNDILSKMIYENPNQWMWVHKRFKKVK